MTTLKLYNTKTRTKEDFKPIDPDNVRMYVCGPTVYDRAHLGNARPVIVFDVLNRLLRHVYGDAHVTYVRNFTDVDDKINAEARRRKDAGAPGTLEDLIRERSDETIQWFLEDMAAVGALEPDAMPRATQYVPQMIKMIEDLITKDHAYAKEGHVLFRVRSYENYGKLSGRSVDDMIAGARVEVAPFKEDPMDFVLWKPSDAETPGWESPWGRGRPGWHIECSAMADKLLWDDQRAAGKLSQAALDKPHVFDIHGGGNDLMFPHHENEIAQSCCANGTEAMANVWMHNEMLQVEGKKMSKSLGNFFTVRDLLEQGVPGEVIRFVMLSTHYRKPMDWTEKKREEAERTLAKWYELTINAEPTTVAQLAIDRLSSDLDTYGAMESLRRLAKNMDAGALLASARMMGLLLEGGGNWAKPVKYFEHTGLKLDRVMRAWGNYLSEKDYEKADTLRSKIDAAAVAVDAGLRQTDPLKFVRSLTLNERTDFNVSFSDFLENPMAYRDEVDRVMSDRASALLEFLE